MSSETEIRKECERDAMQADYLYSQDRPTGGHLTQY